MRVNESSIIDGNNSNEHVIYLLYKSEWVRVAEKEPTQKKEENFTHE